MWPPPWEWESRSRPTSGRTARPPSALGASGSEVSNPLPTPICSKWRRWRTHFVTSETVAWLHQEASEEGRTPARGLRRGPIALPGDARGHAMVLPLLELKEFDQYTTTHAINVAVLTMGLAEFLGMGPTTVRALRLAGLLHDLGKIKIPREILTKPGKLTPRSAKSWSPSGRWRPHDSGGRSRWTSPRRCLRAPPARRPRISPTALTPGRPTMPAGWSTCATSTTRCAPSGPTETRGHRQTRCRTSVDAPGRVRSRRRSAPLRT